MGGCRDGSLPYSICRCDPCVLHHFENKACNDITDFVMFVKIITKKGCEMKHCPECGSYDLKWFPQMQNIGCVQDGRIQMHEVSCVFVLGCEYCSETVKIISAEKVAELLNVGEFVK